LEVAASFASNSFLRVRWLAKEAAKIQWHINQHITTVQRIKRVLQVTTGDPPFASSTVVLNATHSVPRDKNFRIKGWYRT
jgi:hypothetical protein